jgi:hypothetical protein
MVVSISGTTITKGSDTNLSNNAGHNGLYISALTLDNGNVFIAHSYNSNDILCGTVCSISGTTITPGETINLTATSHSGSSISAVKINKNLVFIAHAYSNDYLLYGSVCKIDGTTITKYTVTELNASAMSGRQTSSLLLDNGTVFLAHSYTSDYHLYAQIFGIDYDNNIPTNNISITDYETQIRKVTTGQFDGIAKTSGEGGDNTGHKDIVSIWTKE